jgi:hypothetical protein
MRRSSEKSNAEAAAPPSMRERLRNAAANPAIIANSLRRRLGLSKPLGPMTIDDWRRLADRYTAECVNYRNHAPGYLEIAYEDIMNDPRSFAEQISLFAKINAEDGKIDGKIDARIHEAAAFVNVDKGPKHNDHIK